MAHGRSHQQRRPAIPVLGADVGAAPEKQTNSPRIPALRSSMQWCGAVVGPRVNARRPVSEKQGRDLIMAKLTSDMQREGSLFVWHRRLSPAVEQEPGYDLVPAAGCVIQRRSSLPVGRVCLGPVRE